MTIHLYIDEDAMDQDLVRSLRARGVNVTTALEEKSSPRNLSIPGQIARRHHRRASTALLRGAADASPAENDWH